MGAVTKAMEMLKQISADTEGVHDNVNISFSSFGDSALVTEERINVHATAVDPFDVSVREGPLDTGMRGTARFSGYGFVHRVASQRGVGPSAGDLALIHAERGQSRQGL